jgi:hypothetical protein
LTQPLGCRYWWVSGCDIHGCNPCANKVVDAIRAVIEQEIHDT